jgi:hypothetical protein
VPGCGAAVHSGTVGMVRSTGVPFGGGVVVMGHSGSPRCNLEGRGSQSSPSTRGCVTLIRGILEHGMQRW